MPEYTTTTAQTPNGSVSVPTSTSTVIVPTNRSRLEARISNFSDTPIFLSFGPTAALNSGVRLGVGETMVVGEHYQGPISAFHSAAAAKVIGFVVV